MFFKIRNHGTINTDVLQALLHYLIDQKKLPGNWVKIRSSHQRCSVKRGVLKNFAKFTGKHMCWSLCLIKLQTWRPATLLKMRLQHRCFPVKIAKFLEMHVLKNTCEGLLLSKMEWTLVNQPQRSRLLLSFKWRYFCNPQTHFLASLHNHKIV